MDENKWSFAKAVTEDIMVEPGKGSIDFAEMHKALDECGYDGWCVVEQDLFPVKSFEVPLEKARTCARQASENRHSAESGLIDHLNTHFLLHIAFTIPFPHQSVIRSLLSFFGKFKRDC